jgi:mono/diheme cytochrome c family protein
MRVIWAAFFMTACLASGNAGVAWAQGQEGGKAEYLNSCESCHGTTGKGDGPAGRSLAKRPADLTKLSQSNGGVFPFARVYDHIDGRLSVLEHGPREMPVWGERYKRDVRTQAPANAVTDDAANMLVARRIAELIEYISTLQGK